MSGLSGALMGGVDYWANTSLQNRQAKLNNRAYGSMMQNRVRDLKAAGLNPILAVGQSPGAPPYVSAAQGNPMATGASSALAMRSAEQMDAQREQIYQEMERMAADVVLKSQQARTTSKQRQVMQAEIGERLEKMKLLSEQQTNVSSDTSLKRAYIAQARLQIKQLLSLLARMKIDKKYYETFIGKAARMFGLSRKEIGFNVGGGMPTGDSGVMNYGVR